MTTGRVDPYALSFRDGFWNVIAHCHLLREVRTFATFEALAEFSMAEFLRHSVGVMSGGPVEVLLCFEPSMAPQSRRSCAARCSTRRERLWGNYEAMSREGQPGVPGGP